MLIIWWGKMIAGRWFRLRAGFAWSLNLRREDVRYYICAKEIDGSPAQGRFLVKMSLYPRYEFGDKVRISGILETPFEEKEFSYKNYLRIFKTDSVLQPMGNLVLLEEGKGAFNSLFKFKAWFLEKLEYQLMEPASSLVAGLILGVRKGFSDEVMEQFNVTGLTHIIAVSGYNVSMIIVIINSLLGFVPRQVRFYLIAVFLFLFMVITGMSASVFRAVIMGVISLLALEMGQGSVFFENALGDSFGQWAYGILLLFCLMLGCIFLFYLLWGWFI